MLKFATYQNAIEPLLMARAKSATLGKNHREAPIFIFL
jgi:hypothetical protein